MAPLTSKGFLFCKKFLNICFFVFTENNPVKYFSPLKREKVVKSDIG